MTHRSKVVDTQLAWGDFLREAISEHGDEAIEILSQRFAQFDAYRKKDLRRRFSAYYTMIADVSRALRDAEHHCVTDFTCVGHSQADEAVVKMSLTLSRTRNALRRLHPDAESMFGLSQPEPEDPFSLSAYVEEVSAAMREKGRLGTMSLSPFVDALTMPLRELSDALERNVIPDLAQWRTRVDAQRSFERTVSSIARTLSAEFELAGMDELANALRPSDRRLRGLEQPVYVG